MQDIDNLIRALREVCGNKVYMRDVERTLRTLADKLEPADRQALRYLASDLRQTQVEVKKHRLY